MEEEVIYELNDYIRQLNSQIKPTEVSKCHKSKLALNDPEWINQWYMNEGCEQGFTLNVTTAWDMGFTGRNVVVCIIDDGLEQSNAELVDNYEPKASRDLNDDDYDPRPRYDRTNENKHGTRCAGEIAAKANNSKCGVGVAFNCRIGGIRLLDGRITDRLEAEALSFRIEYIDIFSASWGPMDDGKTVDGPGVLAREALNQGVQFGRKGKGTIYVWAAGNGGRFGDNCNCDGYTSSIYTITIGAIEKSGQMPSYSERCSATLASAFTSGNKFEVAIITPDLHGQCTRHHSGTSASAPIAAGIIALALEANPELSWRDVQHLIVWTSKPFRFKALDWELNGVGKHFSHNYGFGLMNAGSLVELAIRWNPVEPQLNCRVEFLKRGLKEIWINSGETKLFELRVDFCLSGLNYLEHVVSVISFSMGVRGKVKIDLISPANTTSHLLEPRKLDLSEKGFSSWPFMSVHYWGEHVKGIWRLQITNIGLKSIIFKEWYLELFGTRNSYLTQN